VTSPPPTAARSHMEGVTRPANRRHRFLFPATALFGVAGLVSCSGNSGSPTPQSSGGSPISQPSDSGAAAASELLQLTEAFTSIQHGYAIKYPPDWTVTAATKPWPFGSEGDHEGDATSDTFRSPSSRGLVVSSQASRPA
jgi:hypothetical protein